jgi:FkbM family methyltransferase
VGFEHYEEQAFVLDILGPEDVAIDVGAYIGSFTLLMAARGTMVHAFEPAPASRDALARNLARNHLEERVKLYPLAVSDVAGVSSFTTTHASGNRLVDGVETDESSVEIAVTTIDTWAEPYDLSGLVLIKIDAEGADEKVLRGAERVRAEFDPALIVEFWGGAGSMIEFLGNLGYGAYRYDRSAGELVPAIADVAGSGNVIACSPQRYESIRRRLVNDPAPLYPPRVSWHASRS